MVRNFQPKFHMNEPLFLLSLELKQPETLQTDHRQFAVPALQTVRRNNNRKRRKTHRSEVYSQLFYHCRVSRKLIFGLNTVVISFRRAQDTQNTRSAEVKPIPIFRSPNRFLWVSKCQQYTLQVSIKVVLRD